MHRESVKYWKTGEKQIGHFLEVGLISSGQGNTHAWHGHNSAKIKVNTLKNNHNVTDRQNRFAENSLWQTDLISSYERKSYPQQTAGRCFMSWNLSTLAFDTIFKYPHK